MYLMELVCPARSRRIYELFRSHSANAHSSRCIRLGSVGLERLLASKPQLSRILLTCECLGGSHEESIFAHVITAQIPVRYTIYSPILGRKALYFVVAKETRIQLKFLHPK